jgi:hypothetical protein
MYYDDKPPLEDLLVHHGIKGMKWGVHKKEDLVGRQPGAKTPLSQRDHEILKKAGVDPSHGPALQAKYGPGSLGKEEKKPLLTPNQKKVVAGIIVAGGAAAAMYYLHKQGLLGGPSKADFGLKDDFNMSVFKAERKAAAAAEKAADPMRIPQFVKEWNQYQNTAGTRGGGYTKDMVDKLSTEAIHHPAGSIFKRVSTEMETDIRPGGFFASPHPEDVERYKAILPVFWKQWGLGKKEGFVVNLKANTDIKAPSPKDTFEMFKGMLHEDVSATDLLGRAQTFKVKDLFYAHGAMGDEEMARKMFPQFAQNWANTNHPATEHFFKKLKENGFNAVVDMNDAGALSKQPMRLLDGTVFSIDSHETLSAAAIRTAQENIQALVHFFMQLGGNFLAHLGIVNQSTSPKEGTMATLTQDELASMGEDFIEHFGVRGMHWGVRRGKSSTGVNRVRGATIDRHNRQINRIAAARDGVGVVGKANHALGVATHLGNKRFQKRMNKHIGKLNASNDRLTGHGKVLLRDRGGMLLQHPVSLLVSHTTDPKKKRGA